MNLAIENRGFEYRDFENGDNSSTVTKESQVLSFMKYCHLTRRTRCEKILLFLLSLFVLVIIILIIVVALQRKDLDQQKAADGTPTRKPDVCLTPDCAKASARVYESLEMSVDPCQDFYKYACGRWQKKHALTEDKLTSGIITMLVDGNERTNKYLLEDTTSYSDIKAIVKARTLYASCMDLQKIEEKKTSSAVPLLNELGGWPVLGSSQGGNWLEKDFSLVKLLVLLYKYGSKPIINLVVSGDPKESEKNILNIDQPGFGLPGRSYFLDDNLANVREAYVTQASSVAQLFGAEKTAADEEMRDVLELEIDLAKIATSPENRTDKEATYNKMTLLEVTETIAVPGPADSIKFDMFEYTKGIFDLEDVKIAINESEPIVVNDLPYYEKVLDVLRQHGKRTVANYGVWMITKTIASILDSRFKNLLDTEALSGTSTSTSRWKVCVATTILFFPIAVGHMYVKESFDDSAKTEVIKMIGNIRNVFNELLNDNKWMDDETKKLAKDKADAIEEWIGYPEEVMDVKKINKLYEKDTIDRNDFYQNVLTLSKKVTSDQLKELRTPVDKNRWQGSPSEVNAFYSRSLNKILFPAGILQSPVYDKGQPK